MSQEVAKCNQAMKFGQLIEYILINFFMKNHMQNLVEKLFPVLFIKHISGYAKLRTIELH